MEHIPGYDEWKTTPPDDPVCYCVVCGCELRKEDALYAIGGYVCEDCLLDDYAVKKRMRSRQRRNLMEYINEREEQKYERITV